MPGGYLYRRNMKGSPTRPLVCAVVVIASAVVGACSGVTDAELPAAPAWETYQSDRQLPRREWAAESHPTPGTDGTPPHVGPLSLGAAVQRVMTHSPAIKAAFMEIEARYGDEAQAGVKPNPELVLELENFAGSDPYNGFRSSEETLAINQLIELGDKRLKRLRSAHLDAVVAGWDFEAARVQAVMLTAQVFVDVLAAQERLEVLHKTVSFAEKTSKAVLGRSKAGSTSPVEVDRANVNAARARGAVRSEQEFLEATRLRLAGLWGSRHADFDRVTGRLAAQTTVPPIDRVRDYLERNPAIARWSDEIGRRHAQRDVEIAKSVPDVKIGAGVRRFEDTDSTAVVASLSVPLQVFNQNSGAITAAERRINKAEHEEQAARSALTDTIAEAYGSLTVAASQVRSLQSEILPAAESAADKTQSGYEEGRFDLISVLDAQRTLIEVRLELVNARAKFEKAKVQVETLIGRELSGL